MIGCNAAYRLRSWSPPGPVPVRGSVCPGPYSTGTRTPSRPSPSPSTIGANTTAQKRKKPQPRAPIRTPIPRASWAGVRYISRMPFGITQADQIPAGRLTAARQGISCFELGWRDTQPAALDAGKLPDGTRVQVKPHPFNGWNFICPRCSRGCYRLYRGDGWACRRCTRFDYVPRHRQRSIPKWHRLAMLRRLLGASPVPFSPIPPPQYWRPRRRKIVAEIRAIERGLVGHASKVTDDLARRLAKDR